MKIQPLPHGFGAEIHEFAVNEGGRSEEIAALRRAYHEYHLLIFRDCGAIDPERQVEVSGWFGPVGGNRDERGRAWTVLHNDHATGSSRLPFHSDITFMEHPLEGISLHPQQLPDVATSTTFVSNSVAWDALPTKLQQQLESRTARHYYADSGSMGMDWPVLEYWHPARMEHRTTGRPLLFVTEHHVDRIQGMTEGESAELLDVLFKSLYAPERQYEHEWRWGDLLIWDNIAVQHARTRESLPSEGARIMQRVAIGEHGFLDQLTLIRDQYGRFARS